MNVNIFSINQQRDFEESERVLNYVFNINLRLPEQVFNKDFTGFIFEEFDWAMSSDFWATIQRLAVNSKDDYILTSVLEPSPISYFYQEFGRFNRFKLPVTISSDDYWEVLNLSPGSSSADAMLYNSEIVVWVSSSMKWAVWGERDLGVCVFAVNHSKYLITREPFLLGRWKKVDDALTSLFPIQNPKDFSDSLKLNYP